MHLPHWNKALRGKGKTGFHQLCPSNRILDTTYHGLSKMTSPDHLSQYSAHINHLDLLALLTVFRLRDGVGNDQLFHSTLADHLQRIAAKNTVCSKGINLGGPSFQKVPSSETKSATGIGHVIDQDGNLASDGTDQDHTGDFIGLFTFLVEKRKLDV